ncbi:MAG: Lrp/AsnC ligand binding domain-containing protein [Alphaproteobacteria bacterium]
MNATDRRILGVLQDDGRITNIDLAERIGLSQTAVAERVKRLTREGVIQGYGARLAPAKLGRGLLVFIEVKLERTKAEIFEAFAKAAVNAPEVMECHMVAGGFDYLVKARVRDMTAYRQFLADVMLALPGVRETHTYAVMEEVKSTNKIPLNDPG